MQKIKFLRLLEAKEPTRQYLHRDLITKNSKKKIITVSKFRCWVKQVLIKKANLLLTILERMESTIQELSLKRTPTLDKHTSCQCQNQEITLSLSQEVPIKTMTQIKISWMSSGNKQYELLIFSCFKEKFQSILIYWRRNMLSRQDAKLFLTWVVKTSRFHRDF